jgi:hypothetical protein
VLVREQDAHVADVEPADGVRASHVREAPRTAITFMHAEDAPFASAAVSVVSTGDGDVSIAAARCFDAAGKPLAGEPVSFER